VTIVIDNADTARPVYLRIADAIGREVDAGRLLPGQRLPTHRAMAASLGLTVTTVTRAYTEATRRGLIEGEVGRGSFVRAGAAPDGRVVDLASEGVLPWVGEDELASACRDVGARLPFADGPSDEELVAAASAWLDPRGVPVRDDRLVATAGAQQALLASLAALVPHGGRVLAEDVTYPGLRDAAAVLGIELVPVALDEHGLDPASLSAQCTATGARTLYLTPCVQEPTGIEVPAGRRDEIASIARRHGLTIVEDDACGFLVEGARPLAADLPDRVVHVATLSKVLGPSCRLAFVLAPVALAARLRRTLPAAGSPVSPLVARVACRAVIGGAAARVALKKRELLAARVVVARECLALPATLSLAAPHAWLPLARPWKGEAFAAHAAERGVLVKAGEAFSARPGAAPRAVRLALAAARNRDHLRDALIRLRGLAGETPAAG
jgi:DNA-binding transcriptional MocR family regulator